MHGGTKALQNLLVFHCPAKNAPRPASLPACAQTASEPIGAPGTNQFIAADQACARLPGVTDNFKASVRRQAGRSCDQDGIGERCTRMHASVRANVAAVVKCDFHTSPAVIAAEVAKKKKNEPPIAEAPRDVAITRQMDEYTGAQNSIVTLYKLKRGLAKNRTSNRAILADVLTGKGRDLLRDLRIGSDPARTSNGLIKPTTTRCRA